MLTSVLGAGVMAELYGGSPAAVLALHGWGRSREDWRQALRGLDALAVDLPGFGLTPPPPQPWDAADYARLLDPLVAEMDRPVLVGHSFGGRVVAHLAAQRPCGIRGIVFTGVPLVRPPGRAPARPPLRYRAVRSLARAGIVGEARLERARRRHGSADYRAASGVMRDVLVRAVNEDYVEQLRAIASAEVPTALVWGAADATVPPAVAAAARDIVPTAALEIVEGSTHLLDATLATRVRAAIDRLLERGGFGVGGGDALARDRP